MRFSQKGLTHKAYARSQSSHFDKDEDNECPSLVSAGNDNKNSIDSDNDNYQDDFVPERRQINEDKLAELDFEWDLALDTKAQGTRKL